MSSNARACRFDRDRVNFALVYTPRGACPVHYRTFMLALALSLGFQARAAAQASLQYDAPLTCPDREFFLASVQARLRADGMRARTNARLHVKLEQRGANARGRVRVEHGARSAQRNLEAASCEEVAEGLALIAALAIAEPLPQAEEAATTPASAESAVERSTASTATRASQAPPPPRAEVATPEAEPTTAPAREEPATQDEPAARPEPEPRDEPVEEPEPARSGPPSDRTPRWSFEAAFLGAHGIAPVFQPGLQLGAAVVFASGALDWSVRAGGRFAFPAERRSRNGAARFGFWSGLVQLCAAGGERLALHACAVVEPGLYLAEGKDTEDATPFERPWLALGGGVGASLWLARWLGVRTGVELLVPARRDRALLASDVIHEVPPACVRLHLGLEVALP